VPTGILSAGFVEYLDQKKAAEKETEKEEEKNIVRTVVRSCNTFRLNKKNNDSLMVCVMRDRCQENGTFRFA
jgi:hypothetical protein